jgi:hypothetical protein
VKLFFQLNKVDVVKREVYGRATQEVPDKSGEIFDYETSKPLFAAWSGEFEKSTDGKSLGNVRAMHKPIAAGKVTSIDFNDSEKAIDIVAKIVDDDEWKKVDEGVYTGFSIGGEYEKRWTDPTDPSLKRFTAKPTEISLVDNPCVPTAHFTMVKADGVSEERQFKAPAATAAGTGAEVAGSADASTSDRTLTESAPVDGAVPQADGADKSAKPAALKKSMYAISDLASFLSGIRFLAMDAESEKMWEEDDSPVPAKLRSWLADGAAILVAMAQEEVDELVASVQPPDVEIEILALSVSSGAMQKRLLKAGARHSKSDLDLVQKVHDHSVGLGASCGASKAADAGDLQKAGGEQLEKIAKLEKDVTDLTSERDTLTKRVKELEDSPAKPKGVVKNLPIEKKADANQSLAKDPFEGVDMKNPEAVARAAMKAVHSAGGIVK